MANELYQKSERPEVREFSHGLKYLPIRYRPDFWVSFYRILSQQRMG